MNPDPLAALRPLHLPDPVGWWPPALAWWVLAALLLAALAWGIRALWRHVRLNRYRRAALRELHSAREQAAGAHHFAQLASAILRRAALARYGHARVAALVDSAWLEFLDTSARMHEFAAGAGAVLARAPYDPGAPCDAQSLERVCRQWLRRHR